MSPGQQVVDLRLRIMCKALRQDGQQVADVFFRIQAVCLGRLQNGDYDRACLCPAGRITEQPVFTTDDNWANPL